MTVQMRAQTTNPKCPKCGGGTRSVGFGSSPRSNVMAIEYKCQTKGCRATVIQDGQGIFVR